MKNLNKLVSVVMVAYTEEGHIKKVIEEYYNEIFRNLPEGSEFIIYLDRPTDNTSNIVNELAKDIDIKIIEGEKNLGYAGAMTAALKASKNDIVFYSDSSGKHKAKDFWTLLEYESKYDIITGLRKPVGYSIIRRGITFSQRILTSVIFFVPLYDFNTGYKIIHRNIINNVLDECKHTKQSFSTELLVRAYKKGYSVKNVSVRFSDRQGENTGTNFRMLPYIMWHSLKGLIKLRIELFGKTKNKF